MVTSDCQVRHDDFVVLGIDKNSVWITELGMGPLNCERGPRCRFDCARNTDFVGYRIGNVQFLMPTSSERCAGQLSPC
jgi:hypothetical protein